MSEPCWKCGTNAWTDCKHRPGAPRPRLLADPPPDKPEYDRKDRGQGHNFRRVRKYRL